MAVQKRSGEAKPAPGGTNVKVEFKDRIAWVFLNRPEKRNAMSPALNREMIAAGVRKFAGGLGKAHTLRPQPNGELLLTDGPYLETKEHVGGLWILECADVDEVVAWARKGAKACCFPVEVREIFFVPAPEEN